jgi:cell volume regulation protein A
MIEQAFIALGGILLIGFLGRLAYDRIKIPEAVFMVLIGLLIGPGLHLIDADTLLPIVPFVSVLALLLVLLDAGFELNVFRILKGFGRALAFTLLVGALSTVLVGYAINILFGWPLSYALLFGLIASGTTTVAAMTLLEVVKVEPEVKSFIFLETVINDFTLILGTSMLVLFIGGQNPLDGVSSQLGPSIANSIALGLTGGYLWMRLLGKISIGNLKYTSTVGFLFLLYGISESIGSSGLIAALVFSFFLGNFPELQKRFGRKKKAVASPERKAIRGIRFIQGDISFIVRIFFFVLMGAIFDPAKITDVELLIVAITIVLILIIRLISASVVNHGDKVMQKNIFVITTMIPRGFLATVLAFTPLSQNINIPGLTEVVLLLVLATNIFALGSSFLYSVKEPHD